MLFFESPQIKMDLDVVILFAMAENMSVRQLLNAMQVSSKWRTLISKPLFWKRLMNTPTFKQMFEQAKEHTKRAEYVYGLSYVDKLHDNMTLFLDTDVSINNSSFVIFMLTWVLYPHVIVDESKVLRKFIPTSILALPMWQKEKDYKELESIVNNITPADIFGHKLTLPYLHLQFETVNDLKQLKLIHKDPEVPDLSILIYTYKSNGNRLVSLVHIQNNSLIYDSQRVDLNDTITYRDIFKIQTFHDELIKKAKFPQLLIIKESDDRTQIKTQISTKSKEELSALSGATPNFFVLVTDENGRFGNQTNSNLELLSLRTDNGFYSYEPVSRYMYYDHSKLPQAYRVECAVCGHMNALFVDPIQAKVVCNKQCQKKLY